MICYLDFGFHLNFELWHLTFFSHSCLFPPELRHQQDNDRIDLQPAQEHTED